MRLFTSKKANIVLAICLPAMMLAAGIAAFVFEHSERRHIIYLVIAAAFALFSVLAGMLRGPLPGSRKRGTVVRVIYHLPVILLTPLAAVWLLQNFTLDPFRIYPMMLLVNCVFYYLIYLFLSFAAGSFAIGYLIADILFLLTGIANFFVVQFRGSPIVPWDLFSVRTAAMVAGNYSYTISWRFVFSLCGFLFLMLLAWKMNWKPGGIVVRIILCALTLGGLLFSGHTLQSRDFKVKIGMDVTLFTPNVRYRNNGFLAAFVGNLNLIRIEQPDGYSVSRVKQLQEQIEADHGSEADQREASFAIDKAPNIIVIMDEAFSDLAVLGEFETDIDYMPNFRKLMESGNGGQLMVSVKGGNTANTEFEFLSGNTMAFLPDGSVVYQQFIRDSIPVLPSYLASLGYSTTAIHPYLDTGWDRNKVYPLLGFEEFISQRDFVSPRKMRNFISDEAAFEKLTSVFEQHLDEGPQFIFEVTMQNHSGYSQEYPGFTEEVHIKDLPYENIQTRAAEKYLTLVYETDKALGEMMAYFEQVKEPTVIVMFGDHEPSDYVTNVISRMTGYDPEVSLEEAQKSYIVPYFIWNNFGMQMEDHPMISCNYMAADILEASGIPLTQYHEFLLDLQKQLPVVCGGTYIDTQGTYHSFDEEETLYKDVLNQYQILQYNHMTDIKNRVTGLFGVPAGEAMEEQGASG